MVNGGSSECRKQGMGELIHTSGLRKSDLVKNHSDYEPYFVFSIFSKLLQWQYSGARLNRVYTGWGGETVPTLKIDTSGSCGSNFCMRSVALNRERFSGLLMSVRIVFCEESDTYIERATLRGMYVCSSFVAGQHLRKITLIYRLSVSVVFVRIWLIKELMYLSTKYQHGTIFCEITGKISNLVRYNWERFANAAKLRNGVSRNYGKPSKKLVSPN